MQVHRFSESVLDQEQIAGANHIHVKTCACPTCKNKSESGESLKLNCEAGLGAATHVTAAFGLAAAGHVIRELA